jgi:hypothetical protein
VAEAIVSKCPKCLRLQKTRPEQTVGWCPRCQRFQFLYQAAWRGFGEAVHEHLGCVGCADGACRDLVERPDAGGCAHYTHVHGLDEPCELRR